jgi:predicted dehydrogenase
MTAKAQTYKVLIVGCGNMGVSHAAAYASIPECKIVGVVAPSAKRRHSLAIKLGGLPEYDDFYLAVAETKPDIVCIASYSDTHAAYTLHALENGAHVFVEKPLATTVEDASKIAKAAKLYNKKVVVGLVLQHHPSWQTFVQIAQKLGKPLVMRMNLNQQSSGASWDRHKIAMQSMSPLGVL